MRLIKHKALRVSVLRQLGGLGDALLLTPCFRALKETFPGCHVTVGTSWAYYSGVLPMIFRGNPFIDVIARVEPMEFVTGITRLARREFRETPNEHIPNCVIDTDIVCDLNVICSFVETSTQPNVVEDRTSIWLRHCAGGLTVSDKRPILVLDREELATGRRWCDEHLGDGPRIGVVLQAHDPARTWPYAADLAIRLAMTGYRVVTLDMHRRVHDEIPAILGRPIREAAAVIAHLDAVVTPDSGLLHVAGALGVPVLGLFGSTDGALRMREYAGHWTDGREVAECAPCWYIKPCLRQKDPEEHYLCMKRLSLPLVISEMETMLERFSVPRR